MRELTRDTDTFKDCAQRDERWEIGVRADEYKVKKGVELKRCKRRTRSSCKPW
jgi:hypothetical protein